jgi:hypothetical protein
MALDSWEDAPSTPDVSDGWEAAPTKALRPGEEAPFVGLDTMPKVTIDPQETAQQPSPIATELRAQRDKVEMARSGGAPERIQNLFKEGITRSLEGFEQLGVRMREGMGFLPAGSTEEFTVKTDARRQEFDYSARLSSPEEKTVVMGLGEMIPYVAAPPSTVVGKGVTALARLKRVGYATGVGAATGATQYAHSDDERTTNIIVGAVASGGIDAGLEAFNFLRPRNLQRALLGIQKSVDTDVAAEGRAISKETGVPLLLSEETGDASLLAVERAARGGMYSDEVVKGFENKKLASSVSFLRNVLNEIDPKGMSEEELGRRLQTATSTALSSARGARNTGWVADMDKAVKASGGAKFIPTDNLKETLNSMIQEKGHFLASEESQTLSKSLTRDLQGLQKAGKEISVKDAQILLKKYTDWSTGSGRVLKDMETASDRIIGVQLKSAFLKDLDAAVGKASENSPGVIALKEARDNYKNASQHVESIGETVIAQLMNRTNTPAPEKLARTFQTKEPTEIRAMLKVIDDHDPVLANGIRRQWVEDAIDKAVQVDPKKLPGTFQFNPETFLKELAPDSPQFKELFKDSASRSRVLTGVALTRRIVQRAGDAGAGASPVGEMTNAARNLVSVNPIFIAGWIAKNVAPKAFARAYFTEEGINALRVAVSPMNYRPAQVTESLMYLKSLETADER